MCLNEPHTIAEGLEHVDAELAQPFATLWIGYRSGAVIAKRTVLWSRLVRQISA
jgi:hypothetical protein